MGTSVCVLMVVGCLVTAVAHTTASSQDSVSAQVKNLFQLQGCITHEISADCLSTLEILKYLR